VNPFLVVHLAVTILCQGSDQSLLRHTNSLFGITTTAGLVNQGVVGSGSSNGNVGAGGVGNLANTTNVSRNPIFNPNNQISPPVHGGGQHYRGHQVDRQTNHAINKSGNGQGFYRPPPRQQHGGLHGHHSQYDNFGKDQASIYAPSNSGGTNLQSAQPQLNSNANNSNNNVAGPPHTQRRWVPPSRDRRPGGDYRIAPKASQSTPIDYGVGPRTLAVGQHSPSTGGIPPNLSRSANINNSNTVKDIAPNTTYSKFSASLAATHAQAVSSSGGNNREADKELSRNDVAFRKIRGMLNKLTPEKFEKLVSDIFTVGLDSTTILKGVILLIFEKALDEPKYSSMYAQLCKRLDEKAPNFDVEISEKTSTFRRLLLNKCRDEFENRNSDSQQYENSVGPATTEYEEEAKYLAKRKMLGNIKFIGELGKLQIVHDSILHRCCEQLLVGRKRQPILDQAEDLECLCHLMKTCGRILDTPKGKLRMDQYIERLEQTIENPQMPLRIRFMLQDVIDLRKNKWLHKRLGREPERGPRTIAQVREDAARDGCIYMPQESSPTDKGPTGLGLINPFEGMFNRKMDDFFGPSPSGPSSSSKQPLGGGYLSAGYGSMGTGPGSIPSSVTYGDDLSPSQESSARPISNGYSGVDVSSKKASSPVKIHDDRQQSFDGKDGITQGDKSQQQRSIQRDSLGEGIGPAGDTKEEIDGNRRNNLDANMRRSQNQGHYNNMNNYRNDQYHNSRGGGRGTGDREHENFAQEQRTGINHKDNREEDVGNSMPPPVDFGDRYSANRSKDNNRRQQQQHGNNDWGNNGNRQNNDYHRGEAFQRGGRGGRFDNFNREGRGNPAGGPPRFNQRSEEHYNEPSSVPQQPPRFQRSAPNDSQLPDSNNSDDTSDRLAPRFKNISIGQGPPERAPGDIGGGGPPSNREQGGRGMHNNRQIAPDQRYQDRAGMYQQPPPNYHPDPQRNHGMHGQGKNQMDHNNPRMMFPGGPPPGRMEREGSGGFTDRRSEGHNSNSRERELGFPGTMGPPKDVELSLRPPSANMLFKPKTPSLLPKSAIGRVNDHGQSPLGENSLLGPPPMQVQKVMMQQREAPILIKQGSLDGKGRKEKNRQAAAASNKGPTREEVFEKVDSILDDMLAAAEKVSIDTKIETNVEEKLDDTKEEEDTDSTNKPAPAQEEILTVVASKEKRVALALETAANRWKENDGWLPSKMTQTAVTHIYKRIVMKQINTSDREVILNFLLQLNKDGVLDGVHFREAFEKVINEKMPKKEENEKCDEEKDELNAEQVMSNLALTAQWKIKEKLASLSEISEMTADKKDQVSVLMTTLQGLSKPDNLGQEALKELFDSANFKLMDQIAEENRNDAKLASILMDYDISFLMPLLTIRQQMAKQLAADPGNAEALAKWISDNVPSKYHSQVDFVVGLFSIVFSHIVASTTLPTDEELDKSVTPEKSLVEAEKEFVSKFSVVLRPYVASNAALQLTAVYALQIFNHDLGFPKGMLLRSFVNCYELDILDEHAFLQWREDVSDDYPGKGKALFQVNTWLTWLEEAESEEEEEDDE